MPGRAYKIVRQELEAYGHGLAEKPEIVALSKADALDEDTLKEQVARLKRAAKRAADRAVLRLRPRACEEALHALLAVIDDAEGGGKSRRGARGVAAVTPKLDQFRRVVLKVGSALLVDRAAGRLNQAWLAALAEDIAELHGRGADVLVVSSGAIAMGRTVLGLPAGPLKLEESQAAAAVGQIALARTWSEVLAHHGITAGQILVTLADTEERRRYLNARATTLKLLEMRAVPVVNENDTVATTEIRYGDNDRLAARVATMIGADLLVLFSDIDGLYTAPPASDPSARHIPLVERITPSIEAMAGGAASELSRGGMRTKIEAGKIAAAGGTHMIIADGRTENPLRRIAGGRALHLVPDAVEPLDRAQDLDRRRPGAARHPARGRGRGAGPARRREPPAGRRAAHRGRLRARRRGDDPRRDRACSAAGSWPTTRRRPPASSAGPAARSRRSSAIRAGPRWCTGTTWRWTTGLWTRGFGPTPPSGASGQPDRRPHPAALRLPFETNPTFTHKAFSEPRQGAPAWQALPCDIRVATESARRRDSQRGRHGSGLHARENNSPQSRATSRETGTRCRTVLPSLLRWPATRTRPHTLRFAAERVPPYGPHRHIAPEPDPRRFWRWSPFPVRQWPSRSIRGSARENWSASCPSCASAPSSSPEGPSACRTAAEYLKIPTIEVLPAEAGALGLQLAVPEQRASGVRGGARPERARFHPAELRHHRIAEAHPLQPRQCPGGCVPPPVLVPAHA